MKRLVVLASLALMGLVLAIPTARAGIDLTWNACNTAPGGAANLVFDCANGTPARLFADFQVDQTFAGVVSLAATIDVRTAGSLPPFWHMQAGGCNELALSISDARPAECAGSYPTWGSGGQAADAFVTNYTDGAGGADRARMLIAVVRASSDPMTVSPGTNYYGFMLGIDPSSAPGCTGCATPADIAWSSATLESVEPGFPVRTLFAPGLRSNRVTVNGGLGRVMALHSVTPQSISNEAVKTLTILGHGLTGAATVRLEREGTEAVDGTSVEVSADGTMLTASFDVRERRAGRWDLIVHEGAIADTLHAAVEQIERFYLSSIEPAQVVNTGSTIVTVHGFGIPPGATLQLRTGAGALGVYSSVVSPDGRTLTANVLLEGALPGAYDVIVQGHPNGTPAILPASFLVKSGTFRLISVVPSHAANDGVKVVLLNGEGFEAGMTARLVRSGLAAVDGTVSNIAPDGRTATVSFDLAGRSVGAWTVEASRSGLVTSLPNAFAIHPPRSLTTVTPSAGANTALVSLQLVGTGFENGMSATLVRGDEPIGGTGIVVGGAGTTLTAPFDLRDRNGGLFDVVVRFVDGDRLVLSSAFRVFTGIRVLGIAPASAPDTTVVSAVITGSAFQPGTTVRLRRSGSTDIVGAGAVMGPDSTTLTATFDLRGQPAGARDVVAANPDGSTATLANAFQVYAVPRLTAVSPAFGYDNASAVIDLTGANFVSGVTVQLVRGAETIPGTSLQLTGSAQIRATFALTGRTPGTWSVRVTNPGGNTAVLADAFEIRRFLVLTAITPAQAPDTGPVALTIHGSGFVAGAAAVLRRAGESDIPASSVSVLTGGLGILATFDLTGRRSGLWDVVASIPDGQTRTLAGALTILGTPSIAGVFPAAAGDGGPVMLTITGGNFGGTTVRLERPGQQIPATVTEIAPNGASLSAVADLTDRTLGAWDVVLTNPGNLTAARTQGFTITPQFRLISVGPPSASPGTVLELNVTGRWIEPGATVRLEKAGSADVPGTATQVAADGRAISAWFTLPLDGAGDWDVRVTQPGGASAVLPGGFGIRLAITDGGLDLRWSACVTSSSATSDATFDCAGSGAPARLFGNFQVGEPLNDFVAMEAVLDVRLDSPGLPPFWHFEDGGCNATALAISDARDVTACAASTNTTPWGSSGQAADAFVTHYAAGAGGANRGRILLAIVRASSDPFPLEPQRNYFGFELDLDLASASGCAGCASPGEIVWSSGTLYGPSTPEGQVLDRSGLGGNRVVMNGGGRQLGAFAVTPSSVRNDVPRTLRVRGYGLADGVLPRLTRSGEPDIAGTVLSYTTDGATLTAEFDVRQRAGGRWNLIVADPSGRVDSLVDAVELIEAFRLASVDPAAGTYGATVIVSVHGFAILPGAALTLERQGQNPRTTHVLDISADGRTLTASIDLANVPPGSYDLVVRQPTGETARLDGAFRVLAESFRLYSLSPRFGGAESVLLATIAGERMLPGLTLVLAKAGQPSIPGTGVVVAEDGLSAQATFDLRGKALGVWNLIGTNGDGAGGALSNALTIVSERSIQAVQPAYAGNNAPATVQITGRNFVAGVTPALIGAGERISGTGTVVQTGGGSLTTTFPITGRPLGVYDVAVTFPDQHEISLPQAFEIRQGIQVSSMQPTSGADTAVVAATVFGAAFQSGALARLTRAGQPPIPGAATTVAPGGASLTTSFDLRGRASGLWSVVVENPDGAVGTRDTAFRVLAVPRVTAVNPPVGRDDGTAVLTLTGSGFEPGAAVRLYREGTWITGTGTAVLDAATIRTTMNLYDRAAGAWDVDVMNPNGLHGTLAAGFVVTPVLRLDAIAPIAGIDSAPVTLALSGRNFAPNLSASLSRPGLSPVVATAVTVAPDGRSATGEFDVRSHAAGAWDVVVGNPDGATDTLYAAFTLFGQPVVEAVAPAAGDDFGKAVLIVSGRNLAAGATVRLEHAASAAIVADSVAVAADGLTLAARCDLTDRALGLWNVVVINPGGGTARLDQSFEILPLFRLIGVTPNGSLPDRTVTVTIDGRWIEPGATALLRRAGQPDRAGGSPTVSPNGRSMSTTFDLTGALLGEWDVAVRNPGGPERTLAGAFRVLTEVPESPLTLLWGACNQANPPGQDNLWFDCENPGFRARLFGNFRPPVAAPAVVAFSGGIDLGFVHELPPFWHLEPNGCNATMWIIDDDRDEAVCPADANETIYGADGQITDAFITAYLPNLQGITNRARILFAIVRASINPIDLVAGRNYFGFEMGFTLDALPACAGCDAPVDVSWTWALFERPGRSPGEEAVSLLLLGDGRYPSLARVNGGAGGSETPVRLQRFEAEPREDGIEVAWEFTASGEYSSVALERREPGGVWQAVGAPMTRGFGATTILDRDVRPGVRYEYRMLATRIGGGLQIFGPISATAPAIAAAANPGLIAVTPNPSAGRARIEYALASEGNVRIRILDVQGRERAAVFSGRMPAGRHAAEWDGRAEGRPVPAGLYFVRCEIDGRETVRRITRVR